VARARPVRRQSRDEREQRLLAAARRVLHERGFRAGVREILEVAGVGIGTGYRQFPSKEALVRAAINELRQELEAGLAAAGAEPDAREAIAATMRLGFGLLARYGQVVMALFTRSQPREFDDAIDWVALVRFLEELLGRVVAQGHLPADLDVNHAVRAWLGLFHPIALTGSAGERRDLAEVAEATTRFFLAGLQAG
jgi:AcrR family transcriptional regulator